jgi:hypothetical protein
LKEEQQEILDSILSYLITFVLPGLKKLSLHVGVSEPMSFNRGVSKDSEVFISPINNTFSLLREWMRTREFLNEFGIR